ncbi:MAG: CoA transferase, partial [Pseudomonadales bacterium]|nr:CoA transferase [Pseudomonadales bacterium]
MTATLTLDGIRVLDFGTRPSTAWCGRLLADFGAQVIGVETSPHPLRSQGPFDPDGNSIVSRYLLAGRDLLQDAATPALMSAAHVILTSDTHEASALQQDHPQAIVCAITPYGLTGAHSGEPGNDLTACAGSSWAYVNGLQGRPPLKCSGLQASYQSGTFAFGILLAALIEQLAHNSPGQLIDISEREVLVSTAAPAPLRYQYSGFNWARKSGVDMNEGPVPVKDGWFALTISRPAFWIKAMEVLGLPDLATDKELQQAGLRPKLKDRFVDRVGSAMSEWTRMDLFNALGERRVIAGPVLRMDELADNPQFVARGFFREASDGLKYPGPFARMTASGWRTPGPRPRKVTSFDANAEIKTTPVRAARGGQGPLAGFRGLVLTQA